MQQPPSWHEKFISSPKYKWWVLTVVQFGIFFVGVNATIVNVALPTISKALHSSISLTQWIIVLYALIMAVSLPIAGKIPQYLGRKKVVIGGFCLFTLSSLGAALSPSLPLLLTCQIFLAFGGAALLANSNVITYFVFPKEEHGFAMGVNGTVASIGYGVGLLIGGYLVKTYGWQSIYLLNLPFGVAAIVMSCIVLAEKKISAPSHPDDSFDYLGAILFALTIGSFMLSLTNNPFKDGHLLFALFGVISLGLFILRELKSSNPLFDISLFKLPSCVFGTLLRLIITIIYSACLFLIPIYTQSQLHLTPLHSGILMAPFSIALFFLGPLGGKLSDRLGSRWIMVSAFLFCSLAMFILSRINGESIPSIYWGMFLLGAGVGFFVPSNNSTTLNAVPILHVGFVSGFLWSMAYIGTAIGTALSSYFLEHSLEKVGENINDLQSPSVQLPFLKAQSEVFQLLIFLALIGALLCFLRSQNSPKKPS
jgi:EmrB/QacA subfamily drug resistance transporter